MNNDLIPDKAMHVFADINSRINLLIDCSAKDFDVLSQAFMEYHSSINELTRHTGSLFDELLLIKDAKLDIHQRNLRDLRHAIEEVYEIINEAVQDIHQLVKDIAYVYLYINNQKQNISTLKLLTTNMQLEPSSRSLYKELISHTDQLGKTNNRLHKELDAVEKRLRSCADNLESILTNQFPAVLQAVDRYTRLIDGLQEKKDLCVKYNNILKELISKKSDSSSEIITNLQFQDIVRQKIEHVQEAQRLLSEKLKEQTNPSAVQGSQSSEAMLQIILQIRDIASLQAAQMVHANEEYQKAVENITRKFEELDHILVEITQLLNKFSPASNKDNTYSAEALSKAKSYLELELDTLFDLCSQFEKTTADILRKDSILISTSQEHAKYIHDCQQVIHKIKPENVITNPTAESMNLSLQLRKNFEGFILNTKEVNRLLERNHKSIAQKIIPQCQRFFFALDTVRNSLRQCMEECTILLPAEDVHSDKLKLYEVNKDLQGMKFCTDDIQYYSVFDKEIEEIITKLNHLIGMIDFKEVERDLDAKKLDEIKHLYTMKSERDVHSQVTGEKKPGKEKGDNEIIIF